MNISIPKRYTLRNIINSLFMMLKVLFVRMLY